MNASLPETLPGYVSVCPNCAVSSDDLLDHPTDGTGDDRCDRCGDPSAPGFARLPDGVSANDWDGLRQAIQTELESTSHLRRLRWITTGVTLRVAKSLQAIAERTDSKVVIEANASLAAMAETISRDGIVGATLGDVQQHATGIWMIGDFDSGLPRLQSRLLRTAADTQCVVTRSITSDEVAEVHATSLSKDETKPGVQGLTASEQSCIHDSDYLAVVWGPDAAPSAPEITTALMARWIRDQNESRRVVLLMIDDATTLKSVYLWRTNQLPEVLASRPDSAARAFTPDDSVTLRIGSPASGSVVPAWLQLGGIDPGPNLAQYYLPVASIGQNERDAVIRGDGTVTLPVRARRATKQEPELSSLLTVLPRLV